MGIGLTREEYEDEVREHEEAIADLKKIHELAEVIGIYSSGLTKNILEITRKYLDT